MQEFQQAGTQKMLAMNVNAFPQMEGAKAAVPLQENDASLRASMYSHKIYRVTLLDSYLRLEMAECIDSRN